MRYTQKDLLGFNLKPKHMNFVIEYMRDFNPGRAAMASGLNAAEGSNLLDNENIKTCIAHIFEARLHDAQIDGEWLLNELVDNHYIARHMGNINASNNALKTIGQHAKVDAFAAEKVMNVTDKQVLERLQRARRRVHDKTAADSDDNGISFI